MNKEEKERNIVKLAIEDTFKQYGDVLDALANE